MKLTPIKVKGKGSQKNPWKPPSLTHVAKRKRDDDEKCDNRGYELRRMRFKSKKPAAPIEELPTEILERIILMSRNLNFLRSSLRIGYRFSSATFLTELLEAAFAPTWDIRYGLSIPTSTMLDMPGGHWTIPEFLIPGDPDFQSAVLAGKWANTTNILEAQKKWYRRRGGPRRLHEHLEPSHHLPIAQHSVAAPNGATDATDVVVIFERDWETFKRGCAHLLSKDRGLTASCDIHATGSLAKAEYLDLHPSITIPQRLLAGPFDWETARTCFWLVHGGAHLSSVHMWSWEWTKRGYDHIMTLQDKDLALTLLLLLNELKAFEYWPSYLLDQECERIASVRSSSWEGKRLWWCAREILRLNKRLKVGGPWADRSRRGY